MNTITKTIFLTNNEKNKSMGVLKLDKKTNNVFGTLKTYQNHPSGDYVLGIKFEEKIIKQNVNLETLNYSFVISDNVSLDNLTGCVLLKKEKNEITPIIWGSEKNQNYKSCIISSLKDSINKISTTNKQATKESTQNFNLSTSKNEDTQLDKITNFDTNKEDIDFNQNTNINSIQNDLKDTTSNSDDQYKNINYETQNKIDENVIYKLEKLSNDKPNSRKQSDSFSADNHTNCNHSNYVHLQSMGTQLEIEDLVYTPPKHSSKDLNINSQISLNPEIINQDLSDSEIAVATQTASLFESSNEEIEDIIDNELKDEKNSHKFYNMIADQLEEIFERYPTEDNLSRLIENSKWAKIDTDTDNKYYVVGIIYQNNDIRYICYGVPGQYNIEPPLEMREYSQWLPTDIKNPYSNGYWVMYQDADTGENIYIN